MIAEDSSLWKEKWKCMKHNDNMIKWHCRREQEARDLSVYEDELEYDALVALMSV